MIQVARGDVNKSSEVMHVVQLSVTRWQRKVKRLLGDITTN